MKRLLVILAAASLTVANAKVVYVLPAATGTGTSWQSPLGSVQAGVNAASVGDEVWAGAGMYTGNVTLKSGVAVYGGFNGTEASRDQRDWNANITILDGNGDTVITAGPAVTLNATVDGFTVQNGGAGIYADHSVVTVANCKITNNHSGTYAGGVEASNAIVTVTGCSITQNSSAQTSAIHGESLNVSNCVISGNHIVNSSGYHGLISGTGSFNNCTITNNDGAFSTGSGTVTLTNSTYANNTLPIDFAQGSATIANCIVTSNGGGCGISLDGETGSVHNCVIEGHHNSGTGGGIYAYASGGNISIENNLVAGNDAGDGAGIWAHVSGSTHITIANNTVVGNGPDGDVAVDVWPGAALVNNVVVGNSVIGVALEQPNLTVHNNDVFGNSGGQYIGFGDPTGTNGNISADPKFVNASTGDYRLTAGSPCIDTGDNSVVAAGDTDLSQVPRIEGTHVDMGAYEFLSGAAFTFSEAVTAVRILGGLQTAMASDVQRLNVVGIAPSSGRIDLLDAARLVRKAAGLDANP